MIKDTQSGLTLYANNHIIYNMKMVLDTDVLVAGLRSSSGASRQLLLRLYRGDFVAIASVSMMLEYEAVLTRTANLEASKLSVHDVQTFLDSMSGMIIAVRPFFLWRPLLKDPADEHVLEAAVNGGADAIVTFNHRHFQEGASRFLLEILKPGEALQRLNNG